MYNLLSNDAFWTIIGIILGSAINHVFWAFPIEKAGEIMAK